MADELRDHLPIAPGVELIESSTPAPQDFPILTSDFQTEPEAISVKRFVELSDGRNIDAAPLLAIHRGADGYIILGRFVEGENGKEWQTVGGFRPDELRDNLPGLAPILFQDSYASVNGYYRKYASLSATTAFPMASRKEDNLRYLNACYADIDCGRPEAAPDPEKPNQHLPATACVGVVLELAKRGVIPYPSMMAYSGRGLYLFWLLRDEDDETQPARSFNPARVAFYKQINRALHERLIAAKLPIDRGAHDAARVLRVPGSIHSTAGKPVEYTTLLVKNTANPSGTYTLGALASAVGAKAITNTTKAIGYDSPKTGRNPNKRKGYRAAASYAAEDIEAIFQHFNGWKYPGRRRKLTIYATFLKQSGISRADALSQCAVMATNCAPPYPDEPAEDRTSPSVREIVAAAWISKRKRYRRDKLAELFSVTPTIANDLELRSILPLSVRASRANARLLTSRKTLREIRRRHIAHYLATHPKASAREVFRVLTRKGIATNPQTVNEDMNTLGHHRSPGSPGRPRKNPYPVK
jgi:hypothetical protein